MTKTGFHSLPSALWPTYAKSDIAVTNSFDEPATYICYRYYNKY